MKELTEALNSQSFHFYVHVVSALDEEPQPKDDVHLLHSPEPSRCVVALRSSSSTNATDSIEQRKGWISLCELKQAKAK